MDDENLPGPGGCAGPGGAPLRWADPVLVLEETFVQGADREVAMDECYILLPGALRPSSNARPYFTFRANYLAGVRPLGRPPLG